MAILKGFPPSDRISTGGHPINDVQVDIKERTFQTLKLANELFEDLRGGIKKCTVRAGKRDVSLGPLIFESTDPVDDDSVFLFQEVNITEVRYTTLKYLSDEVAQMDGAADAVELLGSLRNFYPDLDLNDEITIIIFNEVKDYGKT